ncbi:hypothetical protein [Herbaspirillum sp. YR522]|uniref:hypothetical protein n=1 Tax=Herbaspirillum sp. YR522 TaxID=1144342 RepID=UPI00026F4B26|nr:hypothetical protein [Herbaspirillum sp. YR522]EJM97467.1 hypothetical protein PMI40_04349 [Herbaspirillum sp. YR522]
MPFHLDDLDLDSIPDPYHSVLRRMAAAVEDRAVTPAVAIKVIREHLVPLLSDVDSALVSIQGQPSWDKIRTLYPALVFASESQQKQLLAAIGRLIELFVRHSDRPPREIDFPPFIEVFSFNRVCGYLGVPIAKPLLETNDGTRDLYRFCKYCWLPARRKDVCAFHTTSFDEASAARSQPACAHISLKQAQRLRTAFEQHVLALTTRDEMEFHQSGFDLPALLPPSGLSHWLDVRRPHLASLVRKQADTSANSLRILSAVLYGEELGAKVVEAIGGAVYLWTPITTRAEGWLAAWAAKSPRGGARRRGIKLLEV